MRIRQVFFAAFGCVVLTLATAATAFAAAEIYPDDEHARAEFDVIAAGSDWTGVRADCEMKVGSCSPDDYNAGGWIIQPIWTADWDEYYDHGYWIELGVIRNKWDVTGLVDTRFYWYNSHYPDGHWHIVPTSHQNPDDYTQPTLKTIYTGSGTDWVFTVNGNYLNDSSNDHTANAEFSQTSWYGIGIESRCGSGRYGEKDDHVDLDSIQRRHEGDWGEPSASYAQDMVWHDNNGVNGNPSCHGSWVTRPSSAWCYRNNPN